VIDRRLRAELRVDPARAVRERVFGHVKGAFTGAVRDRSGRFQAADGGTLFLDEIGELPFELQSKLLRAIQEGQFERVGEERTRRVDVRIVAASNRDLPQEIRAIASGRTCTIGSACFRFIFRRCETESTTSRS
jgi:DNA-binding NtrC family response regulator